MKKIWVRVLSLAAVLALAVASSGVAHACYFCFYQPSLPAELKNLRKF